jgi:hypothetical protein
VTELASITFASAEPRRLAEFWAAALGYVPVSVGPGTQAEIDAAVEAGTLDHDGWAVLTHPDGVGPRLVFHRRPKSAPEHIPIHLDLNVEDREAEVERLVALGATVVETKTMAFGPTRTDTWTVMRDPEGNGFCVE